MVLVFVFSSTAILILENRNSSTFPLNGQSVYISSQWGSKSFVRFLQLCLKRIMLVKIWKKISNIGKNHFHGSFLRTYQIKLFITIWNCYINFIPLVISGLGFSLTQWKWANCLLDILSRKRKLTFFLFRLPYFKTVTVTFWWEITKDFPN